MTLLPIQIALRFLLKSRRSRPLTLFTIVSVLGIAFSVMLFVLIDSLIHGLIQDVKRTMIGFEAPLFLEFPSHEASQARELLEQFSQQHRSFKLTFFESHQFDGLIAGPGGILLGTRVRSLGSAFFQNLDENFNMIWFDGYDQESFVASNNQILLGESLYERLHVMPGDEETVLLTHPFAELGPSGEVEPSERLLTIAGIFWTGRTDYDDVFALIPPGALTAMADTSLLETAFFIQTPRVDDVFNVKEKWQKFCQNPDLKMSTWFDRNAQAFKAIRLERLLYTLVFLLVTIISCFNLAGVVAIFSLGKARDAGILKSLGCSERDIKSIFIGLGLILGGVGGLLGIAFGLGAIATIQLSHITLPAAYGFTRLPLAVNPLTIIVLLMATPFVSGLMAYLPSARFVRANVVEVLKT